MVSRFLWITMIFSSHCFGDRASEITGLFQGNDETKLIESLMANYQGLGLTRPVAATDQPMNVLFKLIVDQFSEIDERNGYARIVATVTASWHDEFLRWNHTEPRWRRIEALLLRPNDIYVPVIIPIGSNGDGEPVFESSSVHHTSSGTTSTLIWVESSGTVHATVTEKFDTICAIDVANFPFDKQECDFYFKVLRLRSPQVVLHLDTEMSNDLDDDEDILQLHSTNPMWNVFSVTEREEQSTDSRFNSVAFRVVVERNAEYYLWNILLPTASLAAIQTSIFFLPFSPERVMFAVTSVLAVDIFQSSLTSKVHSSSEPLPLVKYSTAQLIIGILITIESILVLSLTMSTEPLPKSMVAFLKKFEIVNGKSCLENLMSRFIPMTPVSSARPLMVGDQRNDSAVSGKEIINRSGSISFEAMRANGILVDSGLTDAQLRKFGIDESSNGEGLDQGAKDLAACRPKFPACKNDINQIIHSKTSSLQFLEAAAFDRRASRIRRRDLVHPHIVDRHDLALLIDRVFLVIILAVFSLLPVALFKLSA